MILCKCFLLTSYVLLDVNNICASYNVYVLFNQILKFQLLLIIIFILTIINCKSVSNLKNSIMDFDFAINSLRCMPQIAVMSLSDLIYIYKAVCGSITTPFRGVSQINSQNKGPIGHPLGVFLRSTARIRCPSGPEILVTNIQKQALSQPPPH